jgi:endonuclease G
MKSSGRIRNTIVRPAQLILGTICLLQVIQTRVAAQNVRQLGALTLVERKSFSCLYDNNAKCPLAVWYTLCLTDFAGNAKVGTNRFKVDSKLPTPRANDDDYRYSGYVRGHMCAAADRDSDKMRLKETYLTSNLVPMQMSVNAGTWKMAEDSIRRMAARGCRLRVLSGSVFSASDTTTIGRHHVRVPRAFVKVAVCELHPDEVVAFSVPNSNTNLRPLLAAPISDILDELEDERLKQIIQLWMRR